MLSIQAVCGLPLLRAPGIVPLASHLNDIRCIGCNRSRGALRLTAFVRPTISLTYLLKQTPSRFDVREHLRLPSRPAVV